ncbi:MAG: ketoacyl-ACP synthase III [Bacteroidales bacterium]
MALFTTYNTRISGISACVPEKIISNYDYTWVSDKERKVLVNTIGVKTKRAVHKNTSAADLCYVAAEKLIGELKWDKAEIEVLIFISQSKDYTIPHNAAILQDRLGLPKSCMALDIGLGCSAFVYGLSVANSLLTSGHIKKGLLLMGDISSHGSFRDKSTYPLFGDAGSATAIEHCPGTGEMFFNLQTDGSGYDAIIIPDGGLRNPTTKKSLEYKKIDKGIIRNNLHIVLNGIDVFNFSLREVAPNILRLLENIGNTVEDYDYFVLHQANKLMNNAIRMKLKASKSKFPLSLSKYGNTSSATIPITIVSELQHEITSRNLTLLLSGFGVGLSWGSVSLQTDKIVCPEVLIYEEHIKGMNQNRYHYKVR